LDVGRGDGRLLDISGGGLNIGRLGRRVGCGGSIRSIHSSSSGNSWRVDGGDNRGHGGHITGVVCRSDVCGLGSGIAGGVCGSLLPGHFEACKSSLR
jgi:hypothetical protein